MSAEPAGLYVHVPFCQRKCGYCDFYSVEVRDEVAFLRAARQEFALHRDRFDTFDTLYLGGGTPSVLDDDGLCGLVSTMVGQLESGGEITVEANPDDLDESRLARWREAGVNRLSLGIQSLDDGQLRWLGRRHDAHQARSAVVAARAVGLDELSLDFMYGLPGQSLDDWRATLERAIALGPEHLSCYQLTYAAATPLGQQMQRGELPCLDDEAARELFLTTSSVLRAAGYEHYEVSNFARPGHRSRHNAKYWRRTPYLGLGPSAHSFDGAQRWWNVRSVERYLEALAGDSTAVEGTEHPDEDQIRLEVLMLGLRTSDGVPVEVLGGSAKPESLIRRGLVSSVDGRLRPSPEGMIVADALALDLA